MKAKELPPIEVLRDRFDYNPESGIIRWKNCFFKNKIGRVVGRAINERGYLYVRISENGKVYNLSLHRIAWSLFHNELISPEMEIDHKNNNTADNSISNLRLATSSLNKENRRTYSKTGEKYIYLTPNGRFAVNFNRKTWGTFDTLPEAIAERNKHKAV